MQPRPIALALGIAALALSVTAGAELQLIPAGEFRAQDGRGPWKIDGAIAQRVIARIAARANRTVIDFEHQTLNAEKNGQPAPAAGWFTRVEWRDGQGLFATDVEWTAKAKTMIESGEYRYFSPVIVANKKTGEVVDVQMGALTNVPAIDGMAEIEARAAARYEQMNPEKEFDMETTLLSRILAAIGLPAATPEADALTVVAALKANADKVPSLTTEIVTLKAAAPDPAKYVSVETMQALQTEVASLRAVNVARDVNDVVGTAIADGKLLPAQEKWAKDLGAKDMAALKAYLDTATPIAALRGTQTAGRGPGNLPIVAGDIEAQAKADFAASAALRAEFAGSGEAGYVAFRRAQAEGRVKILAGREARQ